MKHDHFKFLNSIPVMSYVIGTDKNMLYVNDFWLSLTGYTREEVTNKYTGDFLSKKSISLSDSIYFPELIEKGFITNVPFEIKTKSGETIQVIGSANIQTIEKEKYVIGAAYNVSTLLTQGKDPYFRDWLARPSEISAKLTEFRSIQAITQEKMAEIIGVSLRTYQRIEQGSNQPSLSQILIISEYFNTSPHFFITNFNLTI